MLQKEQLFDLEEVREKWGEVREYIMELRTN